jgi:hypothetical protein
MNVSVAYPCERGGSCFGDRYRQFGMGDGGRQEYACHTGEQGFPRDCPQQGWGFHYKWKASNRFDPVSDVAMDRHL